MTPAEKAVLRLVGVEGGSLCLRGSSWKDWTSRGARGLPSLTPAVVTRTVRRLIAAGLLSIETGRPGSGTFAVPTPAGLREMRDPPPERYADPSTGAKTFDVFNGGSGLCYVREGNEPGTLLIGVGFGGAFDVRTARRLAHAILDGIAEIDEPSQGG